MKLVRVYDSYVDLDHVVAVRARCEVAETAFLPGMACEVTSGRDATYTDVCLDSGHTVTVEEPLEDVMEIIRIQAMRYR